MATENRSRVKYSSRHEQRAECEECGTLTDDEALEHACFAVAYDHALKNAHKVNVISTVTTSMAGYVNSER